MFHLHEDKFKEPTDLLMKVAILIIALIMGVIGLVATLLWLIHVRIA